MDLMERLGIEQALIVSCIRFTTGSAADQFECDRLSNRLSLVCTCFHETLTLTESATKHMLPSRRVTFTPAELQLVLPSYVSCLRLRGRFTEADLCLIFDRYASSIEDLDLSRLDHEDENVSPHQSTWLPKMAIECTRVTKLNLDRCSLTLAGVKILAKMQNLSMLSVAHCDLGGKWPMDPPTAFSGIIKLNLSYCHIDGAMDTICDLSHLQILDLSHCHLHGANLKGLVPGCPYITTLMLGGCLYIDDSHLYSLRSLPLTYLDLSHLHHIDNPGVGDLIAECKELTTLILSYSYAIGNNAVAHLASCPSLTHLGLACCSVDDQVMETLGCACHRLTRLNVSGCDKITNAGLASLAFGCRDVTTLDISECTAISDTGIASVAAGCSGITNLNIAGCIQITDAGIASISAGCTDLITLKLSYDD